MAAILATLLREIEEKIGIQKLVIVQVGLGE